MNKAVPWTVTWLLVLVFAVACSPSRLKSERELAAGVAALNAGENANAVSFFERATSIDPTNAGAWYYLGYTRARRLNNFQSAIDSLKQASDLEPANAEYAYQLGFAYESSGKLDEAIAAYERSAANDSGIEGVLYRLGGAYERKGEFRAAIDAYQRSIHAVPFFALSWIALGNLYAEFGAPDAAVQVFQNGIENNPDSAELHAAIGIALFELGRNPEAIAALEQAVSLEDTRASTSMTLGMAVLRRGEMTGNASDQQIARAHFERASRQCSPSTDGTRCAVIAAKLATLQPR